MISSIYKRYLFIAFFVFFFFLTWGCQKDNNLPLLPILESEVITYSAPNDADSYDGAKIFVNGQEIFVYETMVNKSHTWNAQAPNRVEAGFAYFDFEGYAEVKIIFEDPIEKAVIRPLGYQVESNIQNNEINFKLYIQADYVIEPNGDFQKAVHLFCNSIEKNKPQKDDPNVIYFDKGLHTSQNSPYINSDNQIIVPDNTTVYIEGGAVVQAGFIANGKKNISILGRGIIDGSVFIRDVSNYKWKLPFEFNYCIDINLKDVIISDPAGWCIQYYFTKDSTIDGVKMISSRSNGDGISLQSCQNISVKDCFVRTWDDSLVVKNYPDFRNRDIQGTTTNIAFENCVLWTDLAQSMEIGYETVGEVMENITFENITVLHNFHKPVMSIHNGNNAHIKNVVYKNITVEDASMGQGDAGGNCQLIDLNIKYSSVWSDQHAVTSLGEIDGVVFENILVIDGNSYIPISIFGSMDTRKKYNNSVHIVKNVILKNITIINTPLTMSYKYFYTNQYTQNINIFYSQTVPGGANYPTITY